MSGLFPFRPDLSSGPGKMGCSPTTQNQASDARAEWVSDTRSSYGLCQFAARGHLYIRMWNMAAVQSLHLLARRLRSLSRFPAAFVSLRLTSLGGPKSERCVPSSFLLLSALLCLCQSLLIPLYVLSLEHSRCTEQVRCKRPPCTCLPGNLRERRSRAAQQAHDNLGEH